MLVATVVGSGIMAERLSGGNVALALLANTLATGAALVALMLSFGPVSGAHFNPVVSFADAEGFTKPMDYIVLRDGFAQSDALVAELCTAVRALGGYKVPERYAFIDDLPRTTLLKIDRRALRGRS